MEKFLAFLCIATITAAVGGILGSDAILIAGCGLFTLTAIICLILELLCLKAH